MGRGRWSVGLYVIVQRNVKVIRRISGSDLKASLMSHEWTPGSVIHTPTMVMGPISWGETFVKLLERLGRPIWHGEEYVGPILMIIGQIILCILSLVNWGHSLISSFRRAPPTRIINGPGIRGVAASSNIRTNSANFIMSTFSLLGMFIVIERNESREQNAVK